jgi:hypothetical protein
MENIKMNKLETQLGMKFAKANSRLTRMILFNFAQTNNQDTCFHCRKKIESVDGFSIEHKIPWIDSIDPIKTFFDLNNIAFSHLACNMKAARRHRKYFTVEEEKEAGRRKTAEHRKRLDACCDNCRAIVHKRNSLRKDYPCLNNNAYLVKRKAA